MLNLVILGISIFLLPFLVVYRAFVFKIVWNWFIPSYFGLFEMTLVKAIILLFFVSFLTSKPETFKDDEEKISETIKSIVGSIFYPAFFLLFYTKNYYKVI